MAYQYDEMGNVVSEYESEEERRQRELQAQQTENTQPQNIMTEEMIRPQPKRGMMPIPSVTGPINPSEMNRIRMIESGNRDFNANGQPMTSSAGALYASQVMPKTAQDPGFGVAPAQSQTPEEYNRVGADYFNAMKKRYGNNSELAAAAYHSGPGNVDKALQKAQETGQDWRTFLGPQGQQYVQKFQGQTGTTAQPAQQAAPVSPYSLSTGQTGLGLQGPEGQTAGQAPAQQGPTPVQQAQQRFMGIQDNLDELIKFRADPNTPKYLQDRANQQIYEKLNENYKTQAAKTQVENLVKSGDNLQIGKILTSTPKDEEGSWMKMLLLGYISPQLAGQEAIKLGIGPSKWEDSTLTKDGQDVGIQLKRRADGRITGGSYADGTPMTPEDIQAAQAGSLPKGVHITKTDTYIDPKTGAVVNHQTLSNSKERWTSGGKLYEGDKSKLVLENAYTANENSRVQSALKALERQYANPTQQQIYEALKRAGVPQRRIETELGQAPGSLSAQATSNVQAGTSSQAGTVSGGTSQGGATSSNLPGVSQDTTTAFRSQRQGESNAAYEADKKKHEQQVSLQQKRAEGFVEKAVPIKNSLDSIREGIDILNKGEHNIGPTFGNIGGNLPGAAAFPGVQQKLGGLVGTKEAQNTQMIESLMTRQGLEGIKDHMGPSISNFDVQAWLKSNPITTDSSPDAIKKYLVKLHNTLYDLAESNRQNAVRYGAMNPDFTFGNRMKEDDNGVDMNNPLLKK